MFCKTFGRFIWLFRPRSSDEEILFSSSMVRDNSGMFYNACRMRYNNGCVPTSQAGIWPERPAKIFDLTLKHKYIPHHSCHYNVFCNSHQHLEFSTTDCHRSSKCNNIYETKQKQPCDADLANCGIFPFKFKYSQILYVLKESYVIKSLNSDRTDYILNLEYMNKC